ncbi:MAG: hypothetical protein U0836_19780 [Pirellulales bacterium]
MTKTITYEIPDEVYATLEQVSRESGRDLRDVAVDWLASARPVRLPDLTEDERLRQMAILMQYAGCVNSGNPNSGDNEAIDRDLEAEYDDSHESS